jgi:hypothetical protein
VDISYVKARCKLKFLSNKASFIKKLVGRDEEQ